MIKFRDKKRFGFSALPAGLCLQASALLTAVGVLHPYKHQEQ